MRYLKLLAIVLTAFLIVSCADSKDKVADDAVSNLEELADVIVTIKDKASAEAAKPKIESIAKEFEAIEERIKKLGLDTKKFKEDYKNDEALKARVKAIEDKFKKAFMTILTNKEIQEVLNETMNKIKM